MRRSENISPRCAQIRSAIVQDQRELDRLLPRVNLLRPAVRDLTTQIQSLQNKISRVESMSLPFTVSRTWLGFAIEVLTETARDMAVSRLKNQERAKQNVLQPLKAELSMAAPRVRTLQANLRAQRRRFTDLNCQPGHTGMWTVG